ncbi:motility associated factor glycosyltransferase family protein [Carboxydocella sp. ULO1]|uniref:motility associated factor glycosyltransferase family protein n=1 Tax=Carboxydocella sp. ULO1 TaxID=1926599 RepID=UPI001356531F|nr:6-hydroxymethylpterin diphosphokinase MptE-like protein [Carboxydocella sp. ULO1]
MGEIIKLENSQFKEFQINILNSKKGQPYVIVNGLFLHSRYDPIKEAQRWAEVHYQKNHLHILFGFGAGYFAQELLRHLDENDFLLIIEPVAELFLEAAKFIDLHQFYAHERVLILVGFERMEIERHLRFIINLQYAGRVEVLCSPNYDKLLPEEKNQLEKLVLEVSKLELVNLNTIKYFAQTWQDNFLSNLYFSWESIPFRRLAGKLDCPVVIAASGPSLNKQLELLKKIKDQALIIAAGSTINPLLSGGVKPHLVVTIDGSTANLKHFEGIEIDDIPLYYALIVHKEIPAKHRGIKVVFNSDNQQLAEWADQVYGEPLGYIRGGPSVANFCFDLARQISSGPICFIGQDLAYTGNKSHAEGNKYFKEVQLEPEKVDGKKYLRTKGFYGEEVITDYPFLNMKKQFEDQLLTMRKVYGDLRPVYNATEGGVYIEGMEHISFREFIERYCNRDVRAHLASLYLQDIEPEQVRDRIEKSYEEEMVKLKQVERLCHKALDLLKGVSRQTEHVNAKILTKLDKIDEELNELLKSNLVHFAIMPEIFRINHLYLEPARETAVERTKRILDKSEALYRSINKAVIYVTEIIEKLREDNADE